MDGGEEKGKHFFFRSLCGNETLQKADRMTDTAREQKRTAAGRETRMTKAERKRRKDNSRQKDLQERDSCCSTPRMKKKKCSSRSAAQLQQNFCLYK